VTVTSLWLLAEVLSLFGLTLQLTEGFVVSRTITAKVAEDELPEASVAVQVMKVVPIGKVLPDWGPE
jgi:hypothetical protein